MSCKKAEFNCKGVRVVSTMSVAIQLENFGCWVDAGQMSLITFEKVQQGKLSPYLQRCSSSTSTENGKD